MSGNGCPLSFFYSLRRRMERMERIERIERGEAIGNGFLVFLYKKRKISVKVCALRKIIIILLIDSRR